MRTITDESFRFVVHQSKCGQLEYGVESGLGHHLVPYCAWNNGNEIHEVVADCGNGEGFHQATNDELLVELAASYKDGALWLFHQKLALDDPCGTVVTLARAEIILVRIIVRTDFVLLEIQVYTVDLGETLRHYRWRNYGISTEQFSYQPM